MDITSTLFIALGLSMDAFAVSVANGFSIENCRMRHALQIALFFGAFQGLMPLAGWAAGHEVRRLVMDYQHWVAFGLLGFIGGKMIYESTVIDRVERSCRTLGIGTLVGLSIATSIDALAVGVTFAFLGAEVFVPTAIIGLVTFAVSYAGVFIGRRFGGIFGRKLEVAGGLILIGIGLRILIQGMIAAG